MYPVLSVLDVVLVYPAFNNMLTYYKGSIWSTYCECTPAPPDCTTPDVVTADCALLVGGDAHYRLQKQILTGTWEGYVTDVDVGGPITGYTVDYQWSHSDVECDHYGDLEGASGQRIFTVRNGAGTTYLVDAQAGWPDVTFCPIGAAPTPPVAPDPPANPDGIPDPPAPPECSTIADLCVMLANVLSDVQHVFAALGSATDRDKSLAQDLAERLTTIATGVSSNASQLVTVQGKEDAIKADVDSLLPLVESEISTTLGCPPTEVSGELLAFLPSALHALNAPLCALQPATAYTLGESTEFTADLDLSDVDGLLLTLPPLVAGDEVAGAIPLFRYGLVAWGTVDGLAPIDGSSIKIPQWASSVLLLAPSKMLRRAYVHLYGGLTGHYQVVSYS